MLNKLKSHHKVVAFFVIFIIYKTFIDMRKFVGYVNGKSYTNEEDFNKAAQEAIKKNEDNLSITSYYKYTSDKKENPIRFQN